MVYIKVQLENMYCFKSFAENVQILNCNYRAVMFRTYEDLYKIWRDGFPTIISIPKTQILWESYLI